MADQGYPPPQQCYPPAGYEQKPPPYYQGQPQAQQQSYPPPQQSYPPPQQSYPPPQQSYPPPQQGYPPAGYEQKPQPLVLQQSVTTVVVAQQPAVTQQPVTIQTVFGSTPTILPDGNVTIIRYKSGLLTFIVSAVICLFTLEFGICFVGLIPFCIPALKDVEHIHPVTGQVVGVYERI